MRVLGHLIRVGDDYSYSAAKSLGMSRQAANKAFRALAAEQLIGELRRARKGRRVTARIYYVITPWGRALYQAWLAKQKANPCSKESTMRRSAVTWSTRSGLLWEWGRCMPLPSRTWRAIRAEREQTPSQLGLQSCCAVVVSCLTGGRFDARTTSA